MNSKLRFLLISLFIFFVAALQASADGDIRVSGVVMSEGEPLPGASVLVKGTHNGTVTDVDGKYTLTVPADGTLVFSFIGLKTTEQKVNGRIIVNAELLPDSEQLASFKELINDNMPLDKKTTMNIIDLEGQNIMNILARSVLEMYTFDPNPDDISRDNLMRQSIELISKFPTIIAYAYSIYRHSIHGRSLHIRHPHENLSLAENFLYMIKKEYTPLEARMLDLLLVLQAEHGGGNNSTFTVRVTSSTRTDTYSSIAAGIGSLKGPLHGGANIQVVKMFHHLKEVISDWTNVDEIDTYFTRMLNKEVYNKTGLIYGIGHAVYTISDPRAVLLKELAGELVAEKGCEKEFAFLELLEQRAIECFKKVKGTKKQVCSNVDFYSGFIYELMGLPHEIYTPLFAMARIVGWTAHRIEELNFEGRRIIRPAYKNVLEEVDYKPIGER